MNRVAVAVVLGLVLSACTARTTSSTTDPPAVPTTTTPAPTTAPIRVLDAPGGIGDRAYPALGNAAYDVIEYDIALHFGAGLESVSGEVRIRALAGDTLGSFSLDFVGYEIDSVEVDGEEAIHERSERDLRLIPVDPIPRDSTFEVVVRWSGTPAPVGLRDFVFRTGWQRGDLGSAFLFSEPDGASGLFPSNDHPTDRADVTLSVTVPDGVTVVSAGERSVLTDVDGTLHRFVIPEVAPYLIPLAIGDFEPVESADGVVTWMGNGAPLPRGFDRQAEILAVLEADLGRYPFDTLGAVVVDSDFPAALETQTLPTYTTFSAAWAEPVIAHELAHQWFGNEIALGQWDDIWLNEGLATFMTWRWLEHDFGPGAYRSQVQEAWDRMSAGSFPPPDHPGGTDLFNPTVYDRGGLTIAALRHEVGDEAFFRFLRAYVAEFSDATVTTETFLTFVLVVLGPDAEDLVTRWARDPSLPPVPLG